MEDPYLTSQQPHEFTRFTLPGFGLPLDFTPRTNHTTKQWVDGKLISVQCSASDLFKNALSSTNYASLPLTTLREFTMLQLMNELTDKPNWHIKVFDEGIASKWKDEALAIQDRDISQNMVDWCIAELRYKAPIFQETGSISVYNGDVVKSDTAISDSLKDALKAAVAPLENVSTKHLDWHPGSGEKVLDLVHPSLFPLVYGRSRILPDSVINLEDCIKRCGEGVVPVPPIVAKRIYRPYGTYDSASKVMVNVFSDKFQWLPCDIDLTGDNTKITSYINNLHPQKHKDLYAVIEHIISCTIPVWNLTLSPLKTTLFTFRRIQYKSCEYDPDPESLPKDQGPQQRENEDNRDYYVRRNAWIEDTRRVVKPEPGEFQPPKLPKHMKEKLDNKHVTTLKAEESVDLRRDYGKRGLQVIVKLANIHLTPEKPDYEGGTWHVEGQLNEHICATALYYYDTINITTSRLAFRQRCDDDDAQEVSYPQDYHDWLQVVFGCEQNGPTVQEVGAVDTKEGRLITFPNILQHQVQPFKLADPTKPGHRKILALFLVDPNIRIISTANVPCQQREWWSGAIQHGDSMLSNVPIELQDQIFGQVEDFPISLEEAKELRLELMEERRRFVVSQGKAFEGTEFSLCEH